MNGARGSWRTLLLIGVPLLAVFAAGGAWLYRAETTPALTDNDSIMLSGVVNRTGDAIFDDTLAEAMALQLRQSPFLNLVPEQEIAAAVRSMALDADTAFAGDSGRAVCQRAGAKALLEGAVNRQGPSYSVTLAAQDCAKRRVFAEAQAQAETREGVLAAMSHVAAMLREQLGEPLSSVQRYDTPVEDVATASLDAFNAYSKGLRTRRTMGDFDAVPFLRRAIEFDPEFALAYARLGIVYGNLGQADEARNMTARAYQLRARTSEIERLNIEARYLTSVENDPRQALGIYHAWLETYPRDYTALINAALLNKQLANHPDAIRQFELAATAAPHQPLAHINLGQTYFEMGKFAHAKRAYQKAIALNDSTAARVGLYETAIVMEDMPLADRQVVAVSGRRDEADMTAMRMYAAAYRGRMQEASALAAEFQDRALALSRGEATGTGVMQVAISESLVGLEDAAARRIERADADGILGDTTVDEQLILAAITRDVPLARQVRGRAVGMQPVMDALVKLAEDKPADAAARLDATTIDAARADLLCIRSLARYRAGDMEGALQGFAGVAASDARLRLGAWRAFALAMLARAHASLGHAGEARASYRKCLDLLKDADPDLPLLVQVREELSKLGS